MQPVGRSHQIADVYRFRSLSEAPIKHGMSLRDAALPAEGDAAHAPGTCAEEIETNRERFLSSLGVARGDLTLGRQVHGNNVTVVRADDRGRGQYPEFDAIPDSDGLVTNDSGVALGIIVADCVPVILYDRARHVVALIHAGWRGTVQLIAASAVETMQVEFGSSPIDLDVAIGPSIGPCCYEVGDEVIRAWIGTGIAGAHCAVVEGEAKHHLDLWSANKLVLQQSGVLDTNIEASGICTRCYHEDSFFSHRAAMAGERTRGRMIVVAQLNSSV